jgi:hypothetical protein
MKKPDWKNPNDYAYTDILDEEGWAWEFLRRIKKYRKCWTEFQKQVSEYEKALGPEWASDRSTWQFDPPLLEGETASEWRVRCRETALDFEELPFEYHCAKQWWLAHRMPDPETYFPAQPEPVQFLKPLEYPRFLGDEIEFRHHTFQDEVLPYREVSREFAIVAFDLTRSIDRQINEAKPRLIAEAKRLGSQKRSRRGFEAWPKYLRVLDAVTAKASYKEIGLTLGLADNDCYNQGRPASNKANQTIRAAKKVRKNYRAILLSSRRVELP